jgi:hypothetical protein
VIEQSYLLAQCDVPANDEPSIPCATPYQFTFKAWGFEYPWMIS